MAKYNHSGFLLHDNIQAVDQDTFIRCLNFGKLEQSEEDFQYILTLNRDRLESEETMRLLELDIYQSRVSRFTKSSGRMILTNTSPMRKRVGQSWHVRTRLRFGLVLVRTILPLA